MTSMHEPTPEFERYLEWQVTTALRRQDRFARPSAIGSNTYLRAVPIVLLSVMLGAGGVMAAGRLQQNQEKELLTVQQTGELQLAKVQLELAEKNANDVQRRLDVGAAGPETMAAAQRELQTARLKLQCVQLDLEEVQRSGRPAQDELTAPVVGGRDFVAERLALRKQMVAAAASEAETRLSTAQKRNDVGLAGPIELTEAQAELIRVTNDLKLIQEDIALRLKFIGGKVTAEDATRQRLLIAAQYELRYAEAALDLATKRYSQIERQMQAGVAGNVDVLKAQLEMLTRQQDIQRLRDRIVALQKGILPDSRK